MDLFCDEEITSPVAMSRNYRKGFLSPASSATLYLSHNRSRISSSELLPSRICAVRHSFTLAIGGLSLVIPYLIIIRRSDALELVIHADQGAIT